MPVYDEIYINANVREFDVKIRANFLGDEYQKKIRIALLA